MPVRRTLQIVGFVGQTEPQTLVPNKRSPPYHGKNIAETWHISIITYYTKLKIAFTDITTGILPAAFNKTKAFKLMCT